MKSQTSPRSALTSLIVRGQMHRGSRYRYHAHAPYQGDVFSASVCCPIVSKCFQSARARVLRYTGSMNSPYAERVLVVDDDPALRELLSEYLAANGPVSYTHLTLPTILRV